MSLLVAIAILPRISVLTAGDTTVGTTAATIHKNTNAPPMMSIHSSRCQCFSSLVTVCSPLARCAISIKVTP